MLILYHVLNKFQRIPFPMMAFIDCLFPPIIYIVFHAVLTNIAFGDKSKNLSFVIGEW